MADKKVSDLPSINGADVDPADLLYIIDSSAGAAGSKKITVGQYQLAPVSGGTANGVVYLDGSKVESSSSALTFDGTNFATTGTSSAAKLIPTSGTATGNGMYLPAANTLAWSNNGAETMRLDSSGNLGLGVTPSAWGTTAKGFDVLPYMAVFSDSAANSGNSTQGLLFDAYYNSGYKYKATIAYAGSYEFSSGTGVHTWKVAGVGTAGNTISFTQAMTLDASGNLGVGVTSISGFRLDILASSTDAAIRARTSNNNEVLRVESAGTSNSSIRFINTSVNSTYISADGTALTFLTANNERARITSGGEVYIAGTTDQGAYNLQVNGTGVWGAGAYVNGSDERLKDNIQTLNDGLAVVSQLRPVTFQYKPEHSKDQSVQPGFIAQELQQAMAGKPYLDGVVQAGPEYLNVAYQNLIPILTKAIQEQQAIIEDLRARVAALEAK